MRVAVISDIHGNAHALEATLQAIEEAGCDALWCLGDVVGYGPRPNRCCALVEEAADVGLRGNHDLACLGLLDVRDFSPDAAASAQWTSGVLAPGSRAYLQSLEAEAGLDGIGLYHGSPRDPVWEYVLSEAVAAASFLAVEDPLILVGHSHVPLALRLAGDTLAGGHAPGGTVHDLSEGRRWLLNPGSVGQPRDGDPRAAWLLLDLEARIARFERVAYLVERTQIEIRERGLPESLAIRLAHGM
jgi:predicted phosphodiesterase